MSSTGINISATNKNPIQSVISTAPDKLDVVTIREAITQYKEDYVKLPKGMEAMDVKYNEIKGKFYKKYYDFAKKSLELSKLSKFNTSGYALDSFSKIKLRKDLEQVEYNFPYGWKTFAR